MPALVGLWRVLAWAFFGSLTEILAGMFDHASCRARWRKLAVRRGADRAVGTVGNNRLPKDRMKFRPTLIGRARRSFLLR
jgi:hypothetical protein